ncbi:MAG: hypothetical protein ACI92S_002399, partial [Planctomycetaceae bacterium]
YAGVFDEPLIDLERDVPFWLYFVSHRDHRGLREIFQRQLSDLGDLCGLSLVACLDPSGTNDGWNQQTIHLAARGVAGWRSRRDGVVAG